MYNYAKILVYILNFFIKNYILINLGVKIMNIFDVIGPVMIGPSSSHTAGVVRIGCICKKILGQTPKEAKITFYGSFADTYIGHGTDKAIVGGLLGLSTYDPKIRTSLDIAKEQGYNFTITTKDKKTRHANTVKIEAKGIDGNEHYILAESIGGGNILIRKIDTMNTELTGKFNTILLQYKDIPGMVFKVSSILAKESINIANMQVFRSEKGGEAIMSLEVDNDVDENILNQISQIDTMQAVRFIEGSDE